MLILAIDTSTPAGSLAIMDDGREVAVRARDSSEDYSSRLFRELEAVLNEADASLPEIGLYAVATGPGTFTGLRIGLTAAKAWAEVHGKPIVGVSTLEALAALAPAAAGTIAPVIDARRGQVYAGAYSRSSGKLAPLFPDMVCSLPEFLQALRPLDGMGGVTFISSTPNLLEGFRDTAGALGVIEVAPVLAPSVGRIAFERAQRGEVTDALHLDANYVRRSDAELLWKEK